MDHLQFHVLLMRFRIFVVKGHGKRGNRPNQGQQTKGKKGEKGHITSSKKG
jgi:hypothetical protein